MALKLFIPPCIHDPPYQNHFPPPHKLISTRPGRMSAGSRRSIWLVVMINNLPSNDTRPSGTLRIDRDTFLSPAPFWPTIGLASTLPSGFRCTVVVSTSLIRTVQCCRSSAKRDFREYSHGLETSSSMKIGYSSGTSTG